MRLESEKRGKLSEETRFVFGVWMSYCPFLLFTQRTAGGGFTVPRAGAVVNALTLDPSGGGGGSVDEDRPRATVAKSVSKLFTLAVIT